MLEVKQILSKVCISARGQYAAPRVAKSTVWWKLFSSVTICNGHGVKGLLQWNSQPQPHTGGGFRRKKADPDQAKLWWSKADTQLCSLSLWWQGHGADLFPLHNTRPSISQHFSSCHVPSEAPTLKGHTALFAVFPTFCSSPFQCYVFMNCSLPVLSTLLLLLKQLHCQGSLQSYFLLHGTPLRATKEERLEKPHNIPSWKRPIRITESN